MIRWALLAALALGVSGCYTTTFRLNEFNPGALPEGTVVRKFHKEIQVHHVWFGFFTLSNPEIRDAIQQEVKASGGYYAQNLRLTTQHTFINLLIGSATGNLYHPTTVIIDGDAVR